MKSPKNAPAKRGSGKPATKPDTKAKPFQERTEMERKGTSNMARPHPKPSQKAAMAKAAKGGKGGKSGGAC